MPDTLFDAGADVIAALELRGYRKIHAQGVDHLEMPGSRAWLRLDQCAGELARLVDLDRAGAVGAGGAAATAPPAPTADAPAPAPSPPKRRRTMAKDTAPPAPAPTAASPPRVRDRQADPADATAALSAIVKRLRLLAPPARSKVLRMLQIEFEEAPICQAVPLSDPSSGTSN